MHQADAGLSVASFAATEFPGAARSFRFLSQIFTEPYYLFPLVSVSSGVSKVLHPTDRIHQLSSGSYTPFLLS